MAVTRTIGPLHLEDLEPHRFEDLVRQLLYDFRQWAALEATGRAGGDDGFDVRAIEKGDAPAGPEGDNVTEAEGSRDENLPRAWLIQCKREKTVTSAKVEKYMKALPSAADEALYGIIFVAACDFSKTTRDTFYQLARESGYSEALLWGKAELEDQLFQPKNDHLLFAYFGISLQVRRRSLKTEVRARMATKKKASKFLTEHATVLVRDATDERYPFTDPNDRLQVEQRRRWQPFQCAGVFHDGVRIIWKRTFAYLADDEKTWDRVDGMNDAHALENPWLASEQEVRREAELSVRMRAADLWSELPEKNRAWYELHRLIPFDRIIAIDEEGDDIFRWPHIYVADFDPVLGPFSPQYYEWIENCVSYNRACEYADEDNRAKFFPE